MSTPAQKAAEKIWQRFRSNEGVLTSDAVIAQMAEIIESCFAEQQQCTCGKCPVHKHKWEQLKQDFISDPLQPGGVVMDSMEGMP